LNFITAGGFIRWQSHIAGRRPQPLLS